MPSRKDTLRWLCDDGVTALSANVADILELDTSTTASPRITTAGPREVTDNTEVTFPPGRLGGGSGMLSDVEEQTEMTTAAVDAVTDGVGRLTVTAAGHRDTSAAAAAAESPKPVADDTGVMNGEVGAVGGRSSGSLLGWLTKLAHDDAVWTLFCFAS